MNHKLNYKTIGSGNKTLVFAHGILGYWRNFYSVSQAFKTDYTCLLYDQRGHGLSVHKEPYTVEGLAQDLKELLESLDLKSVVLAGHSLGGWVCLYLAYKEPDLVKNLIVIDSSPWPKDFAGEEIKQILSHLPEKFSCRESAREFFNQAVKKAVFSPQLSNFLMGSLEKKSKDVVRFLFDKKGLLKLFVRCSEVRLPLYDKRAKNSCFIFKRRAFLSFFKIGYGANLKIKPCDTRI